MQAASPAYGADAVRFGLLAMSSTQDVRFSEEKVAQGQALANKLFNASRLPAATSTRTAEPAAAARDRRGPLDPLAPAAREGRGRRRGSRPSTSPSSRSASTTSSTASCATGTWSSSSRACTTATRTRRPTRRCCTCCARRSRSRTRSSRSSPRRSGRYVPGTEGLLAGRAPTPRPTTRCVDAEAEAAGRRARSTRSGRCAAGATTVGVAPGASSSAARSSADGYERRPRAHVARLARFELAAPTATSRPRRVADARRRGRRCCATEGVDLGAAERKRDAERERAARARSRAAEGKLANEGFVAKAPPAVVEAERDEARAPAARSWRRCDAGAPVASADDAERYLLAPRAVRHALRAGPHAPAADRARLAAGARSASIHVVGTNGKSSTARMIAAILERHGAAHRRLPVAAPRLVRRAHPRSATRDVDAGARSPRAVAARRARGRAGRPHARADDDRVTQFEALTAAALRRARARGRRRRGRRGRPRRPLGRDERASPSTVAGADERRPRAHALARARRSRDIAREKLAVVRRGGDARRRRRPAPRRRGGGEAAAERHGARARRRAAPTPASTLGAPAARFQRRNFALARAAAEALPRRRSTTTRCARAAAVDARARAASQVVDARAADDRSTARTTRAGSRALAESLPRGPRRTAARRGRLDPRRQGRRGDAARAAAALRRASSSRAAPTRARCRRRRSRRWPRQLGGGRRPIWSADPRRALARARASWPAPAASCSRPARSTSSPTCCGPPARAARARRCERRRRPARPAR